MAPELAAPKRSLPAIHVHEERATKKEEITQELIAVGKLRIAPENTRRSHALAPKIAADFKAALAQDLEVSPGQEGSGEFLVIEGGTRLIAFRELGMHSASCRVHWEVKSSKDRARLFRQLSDERRGLRAVDRFGALLYEEYEPAIRITKAVEKCGWVVSSNARSSTPNAISCTRSLFQADQWGVLEVVSIVKDAWGEDPVGRTDYLILGIAAFLCAHKRAGDNVSQDRLTSKLAAIKPSKLHRDARALQALRGGAVAAAVFDLCLKYYNTQRLSENHLPERPFPRFEAKGPDGRPFIGPSGVPNR